MKNSFCIKTPENQEINATAYGNPETSSDIVIVVHGFKGFKDWGFFPYLCEKLSEAGFYAVSFNFSHNGIGQDMLNFSEPGKFAENTPSLELDELKEVINYCYSNFCRDNDRKIHLLGHSRGGGIALLTGAKDPRINSVVLWASIATFERWTKRQIAEWRKTGFLEVVNSRTKEIMRMNATTIGDIEMNKGDKLNVLKAAAEFKRPLCIVHGDNDLAVPAAEGRAILDAADPEMTEMHLICKTGHTFDVTHPFISSNEKLEKIIKFTVEFLRKISERQKNDS